MGYTAYISNVYKSPGMGSTMLYTPTNQRIYLFVEDVGVREEEDRGVRIVMFVACYSTYSVVNKHKKNEMIQ